MMEAAATVETAEARSGISANVALVVASLTASILALEVVSRFLFPAPLPWKFPQLRYRADPTLVFTLQPNQRGFSADKAITINERGLRGPAIPYERTPGRKRILFLGDSITFGYGVDDADIVTERVRALLGGEGILMESVNTAVPSYNTIQEVAYYEREGRRYTPDVVVVGVCWNDINDKSDVIVDADGNLVDATGAGTPPTDSESPTEYSLRNALKHSRLLYGVMERWRAYQATRFPDDHTAFRGDVLAGRMTPRVSTGWVQMEEAFRRLRRTVDEQGARLLIVAFPVPLALEQSFPSSSYPTRLAAFATAEGIPFIDLTNTFRDAFHGHESLFIAFDADHPNAAGHALAARAIVQELKPWVS